MMDIKGKVAYITGGSKGIGLGVAKVLLDAGMKVAISGRNSDALKQAKKYLGGSDEVFSLESDVTKLKDEETATKKIMEKWGHIDVVLANAGVGFFCPNRSND